MRGFGCRRANFSGNMDYMVFRTAFFFGLAANLALVSSLDTVSF